MIADTALIQPRRGKKEPVLPSFGLFFALSSDLDLFLKLSREKSGPPVLESEFFKIVTFPGPEKECAAAAPAVGAPQAVMVLEKLIALGIKRLIFIGWCGAVSSRVRIGDLIIPTGCLIEEGTSAHYPGAPGEPSPDLISQLENVLLSRAIPFVKGTIWTTDAPYRETREKVLAYQKQGILAVEMEASALMTVARFRGIELAALLMVSDELGRIIWKPGFRSPDFKETRTRIFKVLWDAIKENAFNYPPNLL
jgi:uridine phosphorylase